MKKHSKNRHKSNFLTENNQKVSYWTGGNYKSTNVGFKTPASKETIWNKIKDIIYPLPPRVLEPRYSSLVFSDLAWIKLNCYTHLADTYEITGYGKVENGVITDVKIMKQKVRGAFAEATAEANLVLMSEIPPQELHLWVLDWHSHVKMSVFASITDTTDYNKRYKDLNETSFPIIVFNQEQKIYAREWFGYNESLSIEVTIPDNIEIPQEECENIYNTCYEEVERLVTKETTVQGYYTNQQNTVGFKTPATYTETNEKGVTSNPDDNTTSLCKHCGSELYLKAEKREGFCMPCLRVLLGDSLTQDDTDDDVTDNSYDEISSNPDGDVTGNTYEQMTLLNFCSICNEPLIDEEEIENGLCNACIEECTSEI